MIVQRRARGDIHDSFVVDISAALTRQMLDDAVELPRLMINELSLPTTTGLI